MPGYPDRPPGGEGAETTFPLLAVVLLAIARGMCKLSRRSRQDCRLKYGSECGRLRPTDWLRWAGRPKDAEVYGPQRHLLPETEGLEQRPDRGVRRVPPRHDWAVERVLQPLLRCDLLILDEFGYLPLAPQVGPAIYELIAGRYERRATVITSNKSLATWGDLIGDSALMMAITDRLLYHGEVFYLRGSSFRMRGKEGIATIATPSSTAEVPT